PSLRGSVVPIRETAAAQDRFTVQAGVRHAPPRPFRIDTLARRPHAGGRDLACLRPRAVRLDPVALARRDFGMVARVLAARGAVRVAGRTTCVPAANGGNAATCGPFDPTQ